MTRRIIDISHHQGAVDFTKVAANGIVAIIAKATEGATWVDPAYQEFKSAAMKHNFLWGSFHFGTAADVDAQVEHYLATIKVTDDELLCLDFEENPNKQSMTVRQAREFVSLIRERLGRYPVLYGGIWLKQHLDGKADRLLSKCPLWIAQYAEEPTLPPGWKKYALWQYTDGESGPAPRNVDGIGPCDRNQYNGTVAQLRRTWPFSVRTNRTPE